jgi:hypothetical protein
MAGISTAEIAIELTPSTHVPRRRARINAGGAIGREALAGTGTVAIGFRINHTTPARHSVDQQSCEVPARVRTNSRRAGHESWHSVIETSCHLCMKFNCTLG